MGIKPSAIHSVSQPLSYCNKVHPNICYWEIGTSMLDLIEILFSRHGIQSLRFDGKMSREARDATLVAFKKSGGPKVILIRYAIVRPRHRS